MIIVFMIMMMTDVLYYDDIVNLLPAQMSLLSDVYSRSTGRNPGKTWDQIVAYLIFVIFFTRAKFLENKIYNEKRQ